MAVATTTAILLGLAGAGAGLAASKIVGGPKPQQVKPLPLPEPPNAAAAEDKANQVAKARRAAVTQTVYTSPLGVQGQADAARKTLLGQ